MRKNTNPSNFLDHGSERRTQRALQGQLTPVTDTYAYSPIPFQKLRYLKKIFFQSGSENVERVKVSQHPEKKTSADISKFSPV